MTLPKNFAILTRPRIEPKSLDVNKEFKLDIMMEFPGAWKAINAKWLEAPERLKDGGLILVSEDENYAHYKVWFEYLRKGIAAKEYRAERAEFEIWQHKDGLSVVVNAPRELAELSATLLSIVKCNDPFAIRLYKLNKENFVTLIQYVRSLGGKVTVLQLRYVKTEDMGELSSLKISGKTMEGQNVDKLLSAARKVTRVGFYLPNLGGEGFKFWIGHWGGGTIYTPVILEPRHIWCLIRFFENSLKDVEAYII
jgi:hypothetical protein